MGIFHIRVDSIRVFTLTAHSHTKIQPDIDAFDDRFLEVEAVSDC